MRVRRVVALALILSAPVTLHGQEIVKVPASKANVARPDDLFELPPGQWHFAKSFALGAEPCVADQCEAAFTSGALVVSAEHAKSWVRIIAGFRGCEQTAYSEVEVSAKAGGPTFGRIAKQVQRVVKGLAKTCKMTTPEVPKLEAANLFPKAAA